MLFASAMLLMYSTGRDHFIAHILHARKTAEIDRLPFLFSKVHYDVDIGSVFVEIGSRGAFIFLVIHQAHLKSPHLRSAALQDIP